MHILNSQVLIHSLYHKSLCIYMNNYELIISDSYQIVNTLFVKVCKQIYILYINTQFYMQIPSIKYKLYTIFIYLIGDKYKLFLRRHKKSTRQDCRAQRLTWFLPPHSPAGHFAPSQWPPLLSLSVSRQVLHLRCTMITFQWNAYVDRFACIWHRLSTTDPLWALYIYTFYLSINGYYK